MLWIIEGDDVVKKNKEVEKIKDKVSPDAFVQYDYLSEDVSFLKDSQDLFGEKKLVFVSEASFLDFSKDIEQYSVSPHYFVFCVSKLLAPERKSLTKVTIIDCVSSKETKEKFNLFSFTDAFALKNKKDLWVLYQKATRQGISDQEIVSILLWQVRVLLIVARGDEKDAGINPFVVAKAKKALQSFTEPALEGYMKDLVSMYHDARRSVSLSNSFERFILSL
jgi:DNA polymerase III delta subunit